MSDYISRDYVLKCMEDSYKNAGISTEAKAKMTRWLNKAPAADVRPVVHGKWKQVDDYRYPWGCTNCRNTFSEQYNYCPNCGARMDGEL